MLMFFFFVFFIRNIPNFTTLLNNVHTLLIIKFKLIKSLKDYSKIIQIEKSVCPEIL